MGGEGPRDEGGAAAAVGHDVAAVLAVLDGVGGESAEGEGQLETYGDFSPIELLCGRILSIYFSFRANVVGTLRQKGKLQGAVPP